MKVMITQLKPVKGGRWMAVVGKVGDIRLFIKKNKNRLR